MCSVKVEVNELGWKAISTEVLNCVKRIVIRELFGNDVEDVIPSENVWNAWVIHKNGFHDFVTGGYREFWNAVALVLYEALCKASGMVREIDHEWEKKMGSCCMKGVE
jgi:hypothetical protein